MLKVTVALFLMTAACASDEMREPAVSFSGQKVEVIVLGDGFVRSAGERMPLEAFVLRLRQRFRQLSAADRAAFYVDIGFQPVDADRATKERGWLVQQLRLIGVRQARSV
jgi:hypothetical protein